MKTILEFINKSHIKSAKINDPYYIVVGWDDNFSYLWGQSDYYDYLDTDENETENPAAFIMTKEQIEDVQDNIDDIFLIPKHYINRIDKLKDDWYQEKILFNELTKINIKDI